MAIDKNSTETAAPFGDILHRTTCNGQLYSRVRDSVARWPRYRRRDGVSWLRVPLACRRGGSVVSHQRGQNDLKVRFKDIDVKSAMTLRDNEVGIPLGDIGRLLYHN
jgi:hypothetical protein